MHAMSFPTLPADASSPDLPVHAIDAATAHLRAILGVAIEHGPAHRALVV